MLLSVSSLILSQQSNIKNINKVEIPVTQVTELYNIGKQNIYLKDRVFSAEKSLEKAQIVITKQEKDAEKKQAVIDTQDKIISNLKSDILKTEEIGIEEKKALRAEIELEKKNFKKKSKGSFLKGAGTGTVIGVIGTLATILILNK